MLWKILLTALVIAGALVVVKKRSRPAAPIPRLEAAPGPAQTPSRLPRLVAAGFVLLMLTGAGFYLFHQWRDNYQVVDVRVVDSRTGNSVVYQAYKGDVEGRSFTTTDGRVVSLAEVERMELGAAGRAPVQVPASD